MKECFRKSAYTAVCVCVCVCVVGGGAAIHSSHSQQESVLQLDLCWYQKTPCFSFKEHCSLGDHCFKCYIHTTTFSTSFTRMSTSVCIHLHSNTPEKAYDETLMFTGHARASVKRHWQLSPFFITTQLHTRKRCPPPPPTLLAEPQHWGDITPLVNKWLCSSDVFLIITGLEVAFIKTCWNHINGPE